MIMNSKKNLGSFSKFTSPNYGKWEIKDIREIHGEIGRY